MVAKLKEGAKVADVGCGHGHSTVLMAQAFPKSRFWGFDVHEGSIEAARKVASDAGVADCTVFDATCSAHRLAKQLGDVLRKAGFRHIRRAAETPFNLIIEARR